MSEKDGPTFEQALADPRTVLMVRGAIKLSALGHLERFCEENFGSSGYLKVTQDAGWSQIYMPAPSKTKKDSKKAEQ
ncbi:MAG: hypothetical protein J6575_03635 [Bifidobacterium sp.]|nr:hypothetical protein [Bifidobacterium sp.]